MSDETKQQYLQAMVTGHFGETIKQYLKDNPNVVDQACDYWDVGEKIQTYLIEKVTNQEFITNSFMLEIFEDAPWWDIAAEFCFLE